MSGILSVFQRNGAPVDPTTVWSMLDTSSHRARDGQDIWLGTSIAMGQQRFWSTPEDLGETQPLVSGDGRYVAITDGRLDNRTALISDLDLEANYARQLSDGQLILLSFECWGIDCVNYLLGDFVFAIWDDVEQQLFAARDALGGRSFCYYIDRQTFVVASEVTQILAHPAIEAVLNETRVAEYLALIWDNHEESFYEGVLYCPPAHFLLVTAHSFRLTRYWDVDPQSRIRYQNDDEYTEHFLELLTESIRCRLRSTGPVSISMSGGLDSTSVAALAARLLPQELPDHPRLQSFSYVFDELESCDERLYIEPVVNKCDIRATFLPGDRRWPLRDLDDWPILRDSALQDIFVWLTVAVLEAAAKSGSQLVLTGRYGDHLLSGGDYWLADLIREWRFLRVLPEALRGRSAVNWRRDLNHFGLRPLIPISVRRAYRRVRPREVQWSNPAIHPRLIKKTELIERRQLSNREDDFSGPGQWYRYRILTDIGTAQSNDLLAQLGYRYGIEFANPYIDRRLVEFVMAVPADQLSRPYRSKRLLRNAMDGILPPIARERHGKTSLVPLMERGLKEHERESVNDILRNPQIIEREFIRADWLTGESHANGYLSSDSHWLWLCLSLELWLDKYW